MAEQKPCLDGANLLALLRMEDEKLLRVLDDLTVQQWAAETNCAGWDVHTLVAHLTRGVESYLTSVENGLRGDFTGLSNEERKARFAFFGSHPPEELLPMLGEYMQRFQDFFGTFTEDQLAATLGAHVYGRRSAHWFINQRLAEVAFHSWDIRSSLDLDASFNGGVAQALLPLIVLDNLPFTLRTKEPLVLRVDRWTVSLPQGVPSDQPSDLALDGDAVQLCLLLYGRDRSLEEIRVKGDRRHLEAITGP